MNINEIYMQTVDYAIELENVLSQFIDKDSISEIRKEYIKPVTNVAEAWLNNDIKSDIKSDNKLKAMRETLEIHGYDGNWNHDEYMFGMYNGMELMMAIAEGREPKYKDKPDYFKEHKLIEFDYLITNGFPTYDKSFTGRFEKGWKVVSTLPANIVHPSALDTDMVTIFVKHTPYPKEETVSESKKISIQLADIPRIEKALGFNLHDHQIKYLLNDGSLKLGRATGKTTAYCIKLVLSDGEALDLRKPEIYADEIFLHDHQRYARNFFKHELLNIREKLMKCGFAVRDVII